MKFSQLLENPNKYAYILGMIYAWVMVDEKKEVILAYSSYKEGKRNKVLLTKKSLENYLDEHKIKLKDFLDKNMDIKEEIIFINSEIKKKYKFEKSFLPGVSIKIDLDSEISKEMKEIDYKEDILILSKIEKSLSNLNKGSKVFFLRGAIENRSSYDWSSLFAIDVDNKKVPEIVRRKINVYFDLMGGIFNFNPRLLQENSREKNPQFRLRLKNFVFQYGLFIPFKIDIYKLAFPKSKLVLVDNYFYKDISLAGKLNEGDLLKDNNLRINDFNIELDNKDLSKEELKKIIAEYRLENGFNFDSEDEILYSNQNMKFKAKELACFKCELDENHITFITKKDGNPYVEGHHLIPFAKRNDFKNNIDIIENIVSLCPNCHRKIHFAKEEEVIEMLDFLFSRRIEKLNEQGIEVSMKSLVSFYNINNKNYINSSMYENSGNLNMVLEKPEEYKKTKK